MKIEVFCSPITKQWYFRIVARNGRTVAQSEGYKKHSSVMKTAALFSYKGAPMPIKEVAG